MDSEFDDKKPIYLQIMDIIKRDIVTEKIKGGDKLPSVREMASNLKVNPNTLQRAYQELERLGIIYTQRGTGTFVGVDSIMINNLKKEMSKEIIDSFLLSMKNLGFSEREIINALVEEVKEEK
jgi:GntR family transcriptional regulator